MRTLNKLLACAMALVVPLCTWAQTETEPNNSAGAANPLTYNTAMTGSSGACAPTDVSVDWYSITSTAQGVLRLQTSMSNTGGTDVPVSVLLRNSSQTVIATFAATAGANGVAVNETFTHLCAGPGVYYISIANTSPSVCTNYSLTYDRLAPDYANDSEPNGNAGQTLDTLDAGVPRDGQINFEYGDADDWHRILAPNDGVITVTVLAEHADAAPGTMNLRLRNSSSTVLQTWTVNVGASGAPTTNTFTRNCTGAEAHYFLTFDGPSMCGASYRISYTVAAPFYGDDAEPNQSAGPAIVANANSNYDGRLSFEYDNSNDWFRLQAPTDGLMTVTVLAEHAGALPSEVTVNLRDDASTVIETWTAVIGASGVPVSNTFTHTCSGTEDVYYLSLDTPDDCGVSYRFNYTVAAPLYADDQEPNQSAGPAIIANAGTDYDGRVTFNYDNASDWFRLQAPNDGVITVTVLAENAGPTAGTMNLLFRNSSSTVLETWTANVGANGSPATTTFTRNCTGTEAEYYLDLRDPTVCGVSYRFNYTVAAPLYADDAEPNQSAGPAIVIDLSAAPAFGRASFEYDNTSDWFEVNHPGGVLTVNVRAENAGATGVMTLRIRNSSSTVLVTNATAAVGGGGVGASSSIATVGSVAAGTYYIEVESPAVCGVSYRLDCYDDDNDGVCNSGDLCAGTPTGEGVNSNGCSCSQVVVDDNDVCTLDACLNGNVINTFQDADGDLTCDANDGCPNDPNKIAPGQCGCGVADTDSDSDGTANCNDGCPNDANKIAPGICGCGVSDVDTDGDLTADCNDGCPNDPNKTVPGICGCGVSDVDSDSDGTADCNDLCPNDPNKIAPGICGCGVADTDTDTDGTADCNDGCPNDPNKITPGACGCGVADTDSDSDGTLDCNDACPLLANLVNGDPCDDGNANTINDVVTNCICAGTLLGNDCEGVPGGPAQPGTACNDNSDCTINDVYDSNCNCAGTFEDSDSDGVCDAEDACPLLADLAPGDPCDDGNANTINDMVGANCLCAGTLVDDDCEGVPGGPAQPGTACNDNNDCTINDVYDSNCNCAGTFEDSDSDGVCDAEDACPLLADLAPGDPCDDGDNNTENDTVSAGCTCAGTPVGGCAGNEVLLDIEGDGVSELNWTIFEGGTSTVVENGGQIYPPGTVSHALCLADGCYRLEVTDDAGDGVTGGGYLLHLLSGERIIENSNNFSTGSVSAISGGLGFCLPISDDRLIYSNCDKTDWVANNYLVASENAPVSAEWVNGGANNVQDPNSGYIFWIYDPNGSYSYRRFRSHNVSDGKSPANAIRACHMRINGWVNTATTPHIPEQVLMNVRVRSRVNGVNSEFGPACTFMIDPVRAACPFVGLTTENNTPAGPSCDQTRSWGGSNSAANKLRSNSPQATPSVASNMVRYQFRFRHPESCIVLPPQTSPTRHLNWYASVAPPLVPGRTYQVDVRVSLNGGATWCTGLSSTSAADNCADLTPWGPICNVTIAGGVSSAMVLEGQGTDSDLPVSTFTMYPNPNRGDQIFISLSEVGADVRTVTMDIYDMTGKRVAARKIAVQDGFLNSAVALNGDLSGGLYMVNITAGDKTYTERLVVQP